MDKVLKVNVHLQVTAVLEIKGKNVTTVGNLILPVELTDEDRDKVEKDLSSRGLVPMNCSDEEIYNTVMDLYLSREIDLYGDGKLGFIDKDAAKIVSVDVFTEGCSNIYSNVVEVPFSS